jgi:hypothetical protein
MKLNQEPTIDINQLRDYSSLFSTKNVAKWLDGDFSSIKTKISLQGVCMSPFLS